MRDHQHISCILVSSCHGSVDELMGADTNRIKVREIIEGIKGIPKIFILDACRGGNII